MNPVYDQAELAKAIAYNYVFRGLSRTALAGLAATAGVRCFEGGDVIVRQFEQSDDLLLILEGGASIKSFAGDTVAEFGPGSILGEMALVDRQPRSATVLAKCRTRVAVLDSEVLLGMMADDPEVRATIMTNLSRILSRRLRTMNAMFDGRPKPFALNHAQ